MKFVRVIMERLMMSILVIGYRDVLFYEIFVLTEVDYLIDRFLFLLDLAKKISRYSRMMVYQSIKLQSNCLHILL